MGGKTMFRASGLCLLLGAVMPSVLQTKHTITAFYNHFRNIDSFGELINRVFLSLSDDVVLGLIASVVLAMATWNMLFVKNERLRHITIGVFGCALITFMDVRYAAIAFRDRCVGPSWKDAIASCFSDDFTFLGVTYFVLTIGCILAAWIMFGFRWCVALRKPLKSSITRTMAFFKSTSAVLVRDEEDNVPIELNDREIHAVDAVGVGCPTCSVTDSELPETPTLPEP
jgi:hypothetical protein